MAQNEQYTSKVMEHFMNPRNVGEIPDADGVGHVGNPVCGDIMELYIKVEDNKIVDAKFKTFGCGAAIATSSMITELVKGKSLDEALDISNRAVVDALGGLPKRKLHCSVLAEQALRGAIDNYRERSGEAAPAAVLAAECCAAEGADVEVTFLPSGTKAMVPPGKTLLEAAAIAGLDIPHECEGADVCGSLAVSVEEGAENLSEETDTEKEMLSSLDLKAPHRLACRTQVKGPVVVTIPDMVGQD